MPTRLRRSPHSKIYQFNIANQSVSLFRRKWTCLRRLRLLSRHVNLYARNSISFERVSAYWLYHKIRSNKMHRAPDHDPTKTQKTWEACKIANDTRIGSKPPMLFIVISWLLAMAPRSPQTKTGRIRSAQCLGPEIIGAVAQGRWALLPYF